MDDAVNNYSGHQSKAHPLPVGPAPRRTPMGFQRARPNTWSPSARDISHVPLDAEQANIADEILSGLQLAVVDACNQAAVRFAPASHQPLEGGSLQTFDGQTGAVSLMSDPQTSTDNAATTATFLALADQLDLGQLQPKTTEPSDHHDPVLAVVSALAALSPRTKVLSGVSPSLSERMLCSAVKSLSDHADQILENVQRMSVVSTYCLRTNLSLREPLYDRAGVQVGTFVTHVHQTNPSGLPMAIARLVMSDSVTSTATEAVITQDHVHGTFCSRKLAKFSAKATPADQTAPKAPARVSCMAHQFKAIAEINASVLPAILSALQPLNFPDRTTRALADALTASFGAALLTSGFMDHQDAPLIASPGPAERRFAEHFFLAMLRLCSALPPCSNVKVLIPHETLRPLATQKMLAVERLTNAVQDGQIIIIRSDGGTVVDAAKLIKWARIQSRVV